MRVIFLIVFVIASVVVVAQQKGDTIRTYRLGEIVSEGDRGGVQIQPTKIKEVKYHQIKELDAVNFDELNPLLPSGFVQTNSRGEAIIYLRGASERSIALFFDGIYYNVPWDNRLDLSMIPTDIIGNLKISTGGNSVLYGANVLGGAVNITTTERESDGLGGNVSLQLGGGGRRFSGVKIEGRDGGMNFLGNLTFQSRDGIVAPEDNNYDLQLGRSDNLVTNSYSERVTAYLRGEYQFSEEHKLGLSFNHINGNKGVTPENYPDSIGSRYWKYPKWGRDIFAINGESRVSESVLLKGTAWYDMYEQDIEDYAGIDYEEINEIQRDKDNTLGLRLALKFDLSEQDVVNFTLNGINSRHNEVIEDSEGNENERDFEQTTSSVGLEYKRFEGDWVFTGGMSYDRFGIGEAGEYREAVGSSFDALGGVIGATYRVNEQLGLFGNLGRKSRFPTLRESYSGALNKFIVNPDLEPEKGVLAEIGADWKGEDIDWTVSLFANSYTDLISQVRVAGDSLNRRQRVNLDEATIMGVEVIGKWYVVNDFDLSGNFTYMMSDGTIDGESQELEYKPEIIAFVQADWRAYGGIDILAELDLMGTQYGISDLAGGLIELEPTTVVNLRLSYVMPYNENLYTFYVRGNNLFDTARWNKVGITAAGRTVFGGVNVSF